MIPSAIIFIVVIVAVVAGLVVWIATISARAKRMSAASDARLDTELMGLAANPPAAASSTLAPSAESTPLSVPSSKEVRLEELAGLRSKGLISDDELASARAKILSE